MSPKCSGDAHSKYTNEDCLTRTRIEISSGFFSGRQKGDRRPGPGDECIRGFRRTLEVSRYVQRFRVSFDRRSLAYIEVSLEHMCRNHISLVHFALEWAAEDFSWKVLRR